MPAPRPGPASVVRVFVLGIDPGLSRCGYACVESGRRGPRCTAIGVLRTDPATPLPLRLAELQTELRVLMREARPTWSRSSGCSSR